MNVSEVEGDQRRKDATSQLTEEDDRSISDGLSVSVKACRRWLRLLRNRKIKLKLSFTSIQKVKERGLSCYLFPQLFL
jgi:hypothetical protein